MNRKRFHTEEEKRAAKKGYRDKARRKQMLLRPEAVRACQKRWRDKARAKRNLNKPVKEQAKKGLPEKVREVSKKPVREKIMSRQKTVLSEEDIEQRKIRKREYARAWHRAKYHNNPNFAASRKQHERDSYRSSKDIVTEEEIRAGVEYGHEVYINPAYEESRLKRVEKAATAGERYRAYSLQVAANPALAYRREED